MIIVTSSRLSALLQEDPHSVLQIRSPLPSWALVTSTGARRPASDCREHSRAMSEPERTTEAPLKVAVFGCGAVGTIIAGRLAVGGLKSELIEQHSKQ